MNKHVLTSILIACTLAASAADVKVADKGAPRRFASGKPASGMVVGKAISPMKSQKRKTSSRALEAQNIPWTVNFSNTDLSDFTVIDSNEDEITWTHNGSQAKVDYSPKEEMNDWLITPPLTMVGGHAYTVKFKAAAYASAYNEKIEVKFGDENTVEAMATDVLKTTVISGIEYREYTGVMVPRLTGKNYIGFHCVSDANMNGLLISEISVTEGATGEMPAGVKDLTVTSGDPYSLKATLSFEAPSTTMSGSALSSISKISVARGGQTVKTFDNPAPGVKLTFEDTVDKGGEYEYSVTAANAVGIGYTMKVSHTIGGIAPMYTDFVEIREISNGVIQLKWNPVTRDVEGNTIPEGFIRYAVLDPEMTVIAQDITDTQLTFQVNIEEQTFLQVIVVAYNNVGGLSEGVMSNLIAVGPALTEFKESFPNATMKSLLGIGYEFGFVDYVGWGIADDTTFSTEEYMESIKASDNDNGFAFMYTEYKDTGSSLFTGKIALPAEGPSVQFAIYNQSLETIPDENLLEVQVSEDNGFTWKTVMAETIFGLCGNERGWHNIKVGLHDFAGKTVQIRWQITVKSYPAFLIDNISIAKLPDNDLKVWKFNVPAKAPVGKEMSVEMQVVNMGSKLADSYTVSVYVNGQVEKELVCEKLAAGKTAMLSIPLAVSPVAEGKFDIYASVMFDNDVDMSNNKTPILSTVLEQPVHPYVTDLTGSIDENGLATLNWSKPVIQTYAPGETESFESGEDFAHEFGDWIFVDRDQNPIAQLYPNTIPGVVAGETKASFMVFNAEAESFNSSMHAYRGKKYLASIVAYEPGKTCDDWAITPELNGTSQVISFYARSLEFYYPETMEIYYSFGSINPDDFVPITTVDKVPGEWTQYNIPVPQGAKRFAVRCHSYDAMALLLDDFYFADASTNTGIELEKYNIYCDQKPVGSVAADVTTFSHPVPGGNHTFAVTAVYKALGESKGSNKVVLQSTASGIGSVEGDSAIVIASEAGSITISGLVGESYCIVAVSGQIVAEGSAVGVATVSVAPGLYIVKAGNATAKVLVK